MESEIVSNPMRTMQVHDREYQQKCRDITILENERDEALRERDAALRERDEARYGIEGIEVEEEDDSVE